MEARIKLLLVEDDVVDQMAFKRFIKQSGYPCEYRVASSVAEGKGLLSDDRFDAVVLDYSLGDGTALDLSAALSGTPFVVTTGIGDELVAVEIMKAGAIDYLAKDPENNYLRNLPAILDSAIKRRKAEEELARYRQGLEQLVEERTQELERVHAQLLHAQKMESIGRFAGSIAHDFNNLLTTIIGYANLVKTALPPNHPCQEDIEQILKAGQKSTRLTSQLLTFSRRQSLAPRICDMNELILDMSKMLRHLLREDIELVILPADTPCHAEVDSGQIEQVIINLAVNAKNAMPEGGKLLIETGTVVVPSGATIASRYSDIPPGEYVRLAVSDTGIGMTPEVKDRIFEPFFTTKAAGEGTGLGLSTVFGIVSQHNGYIHVYSEPGSGSTFKIYLPRSAAPAKVSDEREETKRRVTGNETILVVEDEPAVRRLITRILAALGYHVLEAGNGEEALWTAQQYPEEIDLLLSDVVMPQMGGRTLAEHIQEARPAVRILFISGYTDDALLTEEIAKRKAAFLSKPFTAAMLGAKVREALDANRDG